MFKKKEHPKNKDFVRKAPLSMREDRDFDYTNANELRRYLTGTGRIRSRRLTGLSAKSQSKLAQAIKRARIMGLLPFVVRPRSSFR